MHHRLERVEELIKRELSQIVLREVEFPAGVLATITRTSVSPDLGQIKIYVSVLPSKRASLVLRLLNRSVYNLQQKLNKRLKMRPIPRIRFVEETETEEAARVEELLTEIKKDGK